MITLKKYGYAESSDLRGTNAGPVRSVVSDTRALENGMLQKIGDIKKNKEIYTVTDPAQGDKVVLILSALYPYATYTTLMQHEMYLRKEQGDPARAYVPEWHCRYAIADYMVAAIDEEAGPVKDNILVLDTATCFYKELAAGTDVAAYGFAAVIEEVERKSNMTLVRVRVLKNEDVA